MAHKLVVLRWLYKADQDFQFAKLCFKEEKEYFDQICLFFHQAAEKFLKAYIVKYDLKFEKIHDLVKLLKICVRHDPELKILEESCRFLTPFYFGTRYPGEVFGTCSCGDAEEAFEQAKKIRDLIKEKLGIQRQITPEELKKENEKVDKILGKK